MWISFIICSLFVTLAATSPKWIVDESSASDNDKETLNKIATLAFKYVLIEGDKSATAVERAIKEQKGLEDEIKELKELIQNTNKTIVLDVFFH